jgi:hypothetical protein
MSVERAIQHLDRYAQKDISELTARVLEPAVCALPEAFEHQSDDVLALLKAYDADERECARVSTSAKDVFAFAASSESSGEQLAAILIERGASATLASACGGAWASKGEEALKRVKSTPFGTPKILTDVQWELVLPLTGSEQELLGCLDIELSEPTPSGVMKRETFNCEFDHAALIDFFRDVETIQTQIDALM